MRRLCEGCREPHEPTEEERALFVDSAPPEVLYRASGCERCFRTGFFGQTGIFEIMVVDQGLRSLVLRETDALSLRRYLAERGMKTLREDGLEKVRQGLTSLEEVVRVTHFE